MKRDGILKLADKVGGLIVNEHAKWVILQSDEIDFDLLPILERFAALVEAAEREACAQLCDIRETMFKGYKAEGLPALCAATIRARSNT